MALTSLDGRAATLAKDFKIPMHGGLQHPNVRYEKILKPLGHFGQHATERFNDRPHHRSPPSLRRRRWRWHRIIRIYLPFSDRQARTPQATTPSVTSGGLLSSARQTLCARRLVAVDELESGHWIRDIMLVGWSIGCTPVSCTGDSDKRVVGCATIASKTAEIEG